jgi:hypothetical protein
VSSFPLPFPLRIPDATELTARVARADFPKRDPCLRLRDELGPVFRDADFADLDPGRGQPALPPTAKASKCARSD